MGRRLAGTIRHLDALGRAAVRMTQRLDMTTRRFTDPERVRMGHPARIVGGRHTPA